MIITTAIPQITDEFQSKGDVGWYGTAYLLTNCAFQLVFGKLYKFLPVKTMFLASLLLFEAGSAICGAAPNSIALIFGRVIAGLGAGGILPGVVGPFVYRPNGYFHFVLADAVLADDDHCLRHSPTQAPQVPGFLRRLVWRCFRTWSYRRRCLHHTCHLEMVFLHQS